MSRVSSIPSGHEQRIVNWWIFGSSPREIAARLLEEHGVDTTHTSVQRLVDRVSQGQPGAAVSTLKARLRLEAGQIATELADVRARVLFVAGVTPGSPQVGSVEALRELRGLEIADRVLHRKLKVAGLESPDTDAEREHQAKIARLSTLAGVRDGLDWCLEPELGRPGTAASVPRAETLPAAASESPGIVPPAAAASLESVRLEPSQPLDSRGIESYAPVAAAPGRPLVPDGAAPVQRGRAELVSTLEHPDSNGLTSLPAPPQAGSRAPAANEDLDGPTRPPLSPRPGGDPLPTADLKPAARRRPANVTEGLLWARQAAEERSRLAGSRPLEAGAARAAPEGAAR